MKMLVPILVGSAFLFSFTKKKKTFTPGTGMMGEYFSYDEFIDSPTCEHAGVNNEPTEAEIENGIALVYFILDPLRKILDRPIIVNSFFRGHDCNTINNGAEDSKHLQGKAADIKVIVNGQKDNGLIVRALIDNNLPFDRMILEYGSLSNPSWIHVEYDYDKPASDQRRIVMRLDDTGTRELNINNL